MTPRARLLALLMLASSCQRTQDHSGHGSHDGHSAAGATPVTVDSSPHADHAQHGAASPGAPSREAADPHAGHRQPAPSDDAHPGHASPGAIPSGYAPLELTEAQTRSLGLATATVEHRSLERRLTTVGVVTLDESRTAHVHAKVRGVVEAVSVDFVGKPVRRGQALCAIYSQPVLAAQMELIALLKQRQQTAASRKELGVDLDLGMDAVVDGARRRLLLWDVPKAQIARIEKELVPSRTFTLSAPMAGTVIERRAYVGAFAEPGTELYVISDTSRLWAQFDIYEADQAQIRVGTPVTLRFEGVAEPVETTLDFLPPTLDEGTRTLKARASLHNHRGLLRPGAFLTAELTLGVGAGLVVPESAVLRTGKRDIVFVVHGPHVLPREVKVGPLVEGVYRVDAGLAQGEQVATSAQFLLDSDSRLRATSKPGGAHAGH